MADSDLYHVKDKAAVAGVGNSKIHRIEQAATTPEDSIPSLMVTAFKNALDDCGLTRDDIDGIICNTVPAEFAMDILPEVMGLKNVRYAYQTWGHGRMSAPVITLAALAVTNGLANNIACFGNGMQLAGFRQQQTQDRPNTGEAAREGWGTHLETPPYGGVGPHFGAAMALQKYLLKYGYTHKDLGVIAVSMRKWACLNPNAYFYGRPISMEDYLNSRFIIKPMKIYDCSLPGNGAFCIIVTTAERARSLKQPPVYITGVQGTTSSREQFIFGRQGLGVGSQAEYEYKAPEMLCYKMAEIKPQDVDVVGMLDSFSPLIAYGLELFGFCGDGEGLAFMQNGTTEPGGELPINTSGGGLSELHTFGWGHMPEIVRQLRGECGPRQVPNAEVGQYLSNDLASVVFRR